jgi:hypothetical protein
LHLFVVVYNGLVDGEFVAVIVFVVEINEEMMLKIRVRVNM